MNSIENAWYPVAQSADLAARHVFHGELHGHELALWRADSGQVNAWDNRCPHRSVRLTLGSNNGQQLRCQYHGWQYQSGDGHCVSIPSSSQSAPPAKLCARTFAAVDQHGYVWVNLAENDGMASPTLPTGFAVPALPLRSMVIKAEREVVAAALARYADYVAPGAAQRLERSGLALEVRLAGERLLFWLQPANDAKTIVHALVDSPSAPIIATLRRHNAALSQLRNVLEQGQPAKPAAPPKVFQLRDLSRQPTYLRAVVERRWDTAADIMALKLRLPAGNALEFEAGAHIDVKTPAGLVRQYSLVNAPGERDGLIIGVKLEPNSRGGSRSLHEQVAKGDLLEISAPKNHFQLLPGQSGVLIAGGIGITPILAMGQLLEQQRLPYALHYFARSHAHVAFAERLEGLAGLRLYTGLSVDETRVAIAEALQLASPDTQVYVCGPKALLELVRELAQVRGMGESQVHFELFANEVSHADERPFKVRLQRSGMELTVPAGRSLAEVLKEHGVAIDTSCEQGVCGTCRVGLIDGVPEHRDVYLTEQEKSSRICLMPCVSRSRSELLVLDL